MGQIANPARVAAPDDGRGTAAGVPSESGLGARRRDIRREATRWARRAMLLSKGEAIPTRDDKTYAARQLRRAYARIARDFNEAYEQCRSDAQRRALEQAYLAAKTAGLRAGNDALLLDGEGWGEALAAFDSDRTRAERHLASLKTATAVARIRAKLIVIAQHLAVLAT
jgi:hypothetical protein